MRKLLFAALGGLIASPSLAAIPSVPIAPLSYDEPQPGQDRYTYFDDSYTGTSSGGMLTGGLGDLTDGVIATQRWDATPGPYVGWLNIDPALTFHFTAGTRFDGLKLYFDDAQGYGGVSAPSAVTAQIGSQTYTATISGGVASFSFGGAHGSQVDIAVTAGNAWTMLSEARFTGLAAPVPEPGEWAMLVAGLAVAGAAARRRKAR